MMTDFINKYKQPILLYGGVFLGLITLILIATLTQSGYPYEETAIRFGSSGLAIQWYALFILYGITGGGILAYFEFKRVGLDTNILFDGLLLCVPLSIVGARLYYIIFDPYPNYNTFFDYINITRGGLAIHGAVIVTIIALFFLTRHKKVSFWLVADILAVGFLVGQIAGRWGNFMNAEAYGPAIADGSFVLNILPHFIKEQMTINGVIHHPTFLYEGAWNFVGLVFLLIARRKKWFKVGDLMGVYLIWYGLGRGALIEPLRTLGEDGDALMIPGTSIPTNIALSFGVLMLGGILIIVLKHYFIKNQPYYYDLLVKIDETSTV